MHCSEGWQKGYGNHLMGLGGDTALMKKKITECSIQLVVCCAVTTDFETDGTASGLVIRRCFFFV